MMKKNLGYLPAASAVAIASCFSGVASAAMGNIAMNYGLHPSDVATAQALSMFNPHVSATYYNPSYLTQDSRGELHTGLMHAEHELRAKSLGGSNPPTREGDVLQDSPSQSSIIGMKTDLSSLLTANHPVYLGFVAGVEKYSQEMMAFNSRTAEEGQYFRYDRGPLFLNIGGGTQLTHGLDAGFSTLITLHSTADLQAYTNLAGETQYETMDVSAKPSIQPIFGATLDWAEFYCLKEDKCMVKGIETAFTYRAESKAKTTANANTVIPGTIPPPGLTLNISTIDAYQPEIMAVGIHYKRDKFRVGLTIEQQNWSKLEEELAKDTIKDQANLQFKDIIVPRLGAEYTFLEDYMFVKSMTGSIGVAFEESPLESTRSQDVNYFDNDAIVFGFGVRSELKMLDFLAYPIYMDFGYQYKKLEEREFELVHGQNPDDPDSYETVEASGDVHVFNGSISMKF